MDYKAQYLYMKDQNRNLDFKCQDLNKKIDRLELNLLKKIDSIKKGYRAILRPNDIKKMDDLFFLYIMKKVKNE